MIAQVKQIQGTFIQDEGHLLLNEQPPTDVVTVGSCKQENPTHVVDCIEGQEKLTWIQRWSWDR